MIKELRLQTSNDTAHFLSLSFPGYLTTSGKEDWGNKLAVFLVIRRKRQKVPYMVIVWTSDQGSTGFFGCPFNPERELAQFLAISSPTPDLLPLTAVEE
eukprot:scaffold238_cov95-Cylindrotheca_fusiformis.AAC.5